MFSTAFDNRNFTGDKNALFDLRGVFRQIPLHIFNEFRRINDCYFRNQPHIKPASPGVVADICVEDPEVAFAFEVTFGQREFLQQEVLGHHGHLPADVAAVAAGHPEDVHSLFLVRFLVGPFLVQNFHFADAVYLENFVMAVLKVVGADVNVVGGESVRLHEAVAHGVGVAGFVALQKDLLLLAGGLGDAGHVGGIAAAVHIIGHAGAVADDGEFLLDALLQGVGGHEGVQQRVDEVRFLLGEVHQPPEVRGRRRHLLELVGVREELRDDESRIAEGVDVAVDSALRHPQTLAEFVHRVVYVARHTLHQAQHPFDFWLVHRAILFTNSTTYPLIHLYR